MNVPDVGGALGAVGVQQRVGHRSREDEVELPREVGHVAQVRAHPLPGERRHEVRGVAGEQHPAVTPPVEPLGLEPVDRVPFERGGLRGHAPRLQQPPRHVGAVELGRVLTGQCHELPAPPPRAAGHDRGRPPWVAQLPGGRVEHDGLVRDDVDDEPVELETEIGAVRPDQVPDRAVGAVGTHDPAGRHLLGVAVVRAQGQRDGVRGLRETDRGRALPDGDARSAAGARVEVPLELVLGEEVRGIPPGRAGAAPVELEQRVTAPVPPLVHVVVGLDVRAVVGPDADRLQDAGDLVVEVGGAGPGEQPGVALDDQHPVAAVAEDGGQELADRSVTDDGDVVAGVHVRSPPLEHPASARAAAPRSRHRWTAGRRRRARASRTRSPPPRWTRRGSRRRTGRDRRP